LPIPVISTTGMEGVLGMGISGLDLRAGRELLLRHLPGGTYS